MKKIVLVLSMLILASCMSDPNYTPREKAATKYKQPEKSSAVAAATKNYAGAGAETYTFDKEHTTILFYINHLGFSDKIGRFDDYDGTIVLDREKPENSSVQIVIRPKGINTGSKALDNEVQKKDWFNSAKYPTITFKSTQVEQTGPNTAEVTGWLTMLGQEKPLTLRVLFTRSGTHPVNNKKVAGFKADFNIKRTDYGMNNFVPMVGEMVRIHVEAEGYKQD